MNWLDKWLTALPIIIMIEMGLAIIPYTIRGKYGRIHSKTDCYENLVHASDSKESAKREIALWFDEDELVN